MILSIIYSLMDTLHKSIDSIQIFDSQKQI